MLFGLALLISQGITFAALDPRLLLPLLLMALPALYVWREGVDVLPGGLMTRSFWPRYYTYTHLDTWYVDWRPHRHLLTIWDAHQRKVFESRTGHLHGSCRPPPANPSC